MKYIICQEWKNTKGNHAGMVHLCKLLKKQAPDKYKLIIVPDLIIYFSNKNLVSIQYKLQRYLYRLIYFFISLKLIWKIKSGDTIYLFEYLLKERNQFHLAKWMKKVFGNKIQIYGLAHLTPTRLNEIYSKKEIIRQTECLDYIITLGSSLSDYFIQNGIKSKKILTTFHYVDTSYYYPTIRKKKSDELVVIIMGMQMRDFSLISNIVKNNPEIHFVICSGLLALENHFIGCTNVVIKGFISEENLKAEMNKADISLNLMKDTVGSNVITTSMAMSLVNLASNVGSISDYCNSHNSFLCNNINEFSEAIHLLNKDKKRLSKMQDASLEHSKIFTFAHFYEYFRKLN